ncbi:MAG: TIGR01777 family oxidoreductase [Acidobacteriota bacterium]
MRLDFEKRELLDLRRPLRIAVSGASGLIGRELCLLLECAGHEVLKLVRDETGENTANIHWDPASGRIDRDGLDGLDAVVHLAGENISTGRWTRAKKEAILQSRSKGTALLADAIARLKRPPRVLLSASAVHYYGVAGRGPVDESAGPGEGFLASVCREWEKAARGCEEVGVRLVHPRLGVVVSGHGGMLKRLLLPFSLGLGGPVGHGRQMLSWISLDDLLKCFCDLIGNESYEGPVNAVSPNAVSNKQFARMLGRVLGRPAALPLPAAFVKLAFGEMGKELLLNGVTVVPGVLRSKNFRFRFAELTHALRFELGRVQSGS